MRALLPAIISVLLTSISFAQEAATPSEKKEFKDVYYMCKSGTTVRTIRVEIKEKTCIGIYTKEGNDQVVANYKNSKACHPVVENIKTNLEKSKWKCKDISSSRVSSSVN